jgi:hypothetical protein
MNRVLGAARMQLAHPLLAFGVPIAIVCSSFAINLAIWGVGDVADQSPGDGSTGGVISLYITVLVIFIQAVTQVFPFAMGLSLSRRAFYAGTALSAVAQSVLYGAALCVLEAIEKATGGWGVRLHFWAPAPVDVDDPALQFAVFALPMLACAFIGMGIGVVFKRWGTPGIYALTLGSLLIAGLASVWVTWRAAWGDLGTWLLDQSAATLTIALPAVVVVVLAALSYLGLRRAVP